MTAWRGAGGFTLLRLYTMDDVASIDTRHELTFAQIIPDDDDLFAIFPYGCDASAQAVIFGAGHRLALGYGQGRGETQER